METWKTGDKVSIACDGRTVAGTVKLASSNSVSLMLEFEAILAEHVGMMPVLRHDDGIYRSIVNNVAVALTRPPSDFVLVSPDGDFYLAAGDFLSHVTQADTEAPRCFATQAEAENAWQDRLAQFQAEGDTPIPLHPVRYDAIFPNPPPRG